MSKTVITTMSVQTVGDGENRTDTFVVTNINGVPPTNVNLPNNAMPVTVPIPAGALGALLNSVSSFQLQGIAGDSGMRVSGGAFALLYFAPTLASFSLQLIGGGTNQVVEIRWL